MPWCQIIVSFYFTIMPIKESWVSNWHSNNDLEDMAISQNGMENREQLCKSWQQCLFSTNCISLDRALHAGIHIAGMWISVLIRVTPIDKLLPTWSGKPQRQFFPATRIPATKIPAAKLPACSTCYLVIYSLWRSNTAVRTYTVVPHLTNVLFRYVK